MACAIPIVDVSPFLVQIGGSDKNDAVLATAQEWDNAMKEFGCAVIVGHGISESTFDRVNAECRDFFSKSLKEKLVYNHGIYGNPNGGYTSPGNEIVASSMDGASVADEPKKFDPVENFVFTSHPSEYVSPAGLPSPFLSATQYYECMENVLAAIHRMSCVALGIENVDYFRQFYDKTLPGNERLGINGNALRLAHYPPINPEALHANDASAGNFDDKVRYGAHTDYQGFTILRPDKTDWHILEMPMGNAAGSKIRVQCGGLEVYHRSQQRWLQVRIPRELNALVVNAGDLIQRWTNDYWHSPLHRVVTSAAVDNQSAADNTAAEEASPAPAPVDIDIASAGVASRQAIVFFTGPLEDCIVEALDPSLMRNVPPSAMSATRYPPIRSGDHLLMKLNRTNLS